MKYNKNTSKFFLQADVYHDNSGFGTVFFDTLFENIESNLISHYILMLQIVQTYDSRIEPNTIQWIEPNRTQLNKIKWEVHKTNQNGNTCAVSSSKREKTIVSSKRKKFIVIFVALLIAFLKMFII